MYITSIDRVWRTYFALFREDKASTFALYSSVCSEFKGSGSHLQSQNVRLAKNNDGEVDTM